MLAKGRGKKKYSLWVVHTTGVKEESSARPQLFSKNYHFLFLLSKMSIIILVGLLDKNKIME